MTVLKALLASFIIIPFAISTASAIDDSHTLKRVGIISKKSTLTPKPMANSQITEQKRILNPIIILQPQMLRPEMAEEVSYATHDTAVSKDCYSRFGSPPIVYVLGHAYTIDCSQWTYLSSE